MSDAQQIPIYEDMLARARREGNQLQESEAVNALGVMYADRGDIHKGIEFLKEALRLRRDVLRDNDKAAMTCQNLAGCYELGLRDLATAVKYLEMAANLASPNNPQKKTYEAMAASRREELRRK